MSYYSSSSVASVSPSKCSESSESSESSNDSDFELVETPDEPEHLDEVADRVKIDHLKRELEGTWIIHDNVGGDEFLRQTGEDELSRVLFFTAPKSIAFPSDNCMELASLVDTTKHKLLRIPLGGSFNVAHLGVTSFFTKNSVKVVWGLDEEVGKNSEELMVMHKKLFVINERFEYRSIRTYIKLSDFDAHLSQLSWYKTDNSELVARCTRLELENSELFLEKTMLKWQMDEMERQLGNYTQRPCSLDQVRAIDEMLQKLHVVAAHPNLIVRREEAAPVRMPEIYAYVLGSWEMVGDRAAVPREYHTVTYAFNTASCKLWRKLNEQKFEEIQQEIVVLDDTKMMIVERENWKYMRIAKWQNEQLQAASVNNGRVEFLTVYKRV